MVTRDSGPDPPVPPKAAQRKFERTIRQLLAVPKSELDARLRAEKERSKRPPSG
jgi:hypothetical protein